MTDLGITGFDPLDENLTPESAERPFFQDATRRVIQNILRSYTGYFDVFSELLQNSLDAIDEKRSAAKKPYAPRLNILIDILNNKIRVVDNGIGMTLNQFKYCFRPSVSYKHRRESRGHKGVGATFLAYNYDYIKLQSKKDGQAIAAALKLGRHWAEDRTSSVQRPLFEGVQFDCQELLTEESGTCVEIHISKGQRPNLSWLGATSANVWFDALRLRTPLGGIYLIAPDRKIEIDGTIEVIDAAGSRTVHRFSRSEYYYPHELPNIHKIKSITEIENRMNSLTGDPGNRMTRLGDEYRRLDAIYEIWTYDQILENDILMRNISDDQKEIIGRHKLCIYGCFASTAKTWTDFQNNYLKVHKNASMLKGGMLLASDFMVQGDLYVIPLTSTIGYQNNTHLILHLLDGDPDMGRKVFQPEIKLLADELSRRCVDIFKKYLALMREDTGAPPPYSSRDLWKWKTDQDNRRTTHPLNCRFDSRSVAVTSEPQSEQDVIALFHEIVGLEGVEGYLFLGTSGYGQYDSVFLTHYSRKHVYEKNNSKLGVSDNVVDGKESAPYILEYKYDLDGLIADVESEKKFLRDIDLLVCWQIGEDYKDSYSIRPYLVGDEGSTRHFYAATHALYRDREKDLEIICLKDLIGYINQPEAIEGEQRARYGAA